jgi:hypothetical protein
LIYIFQIFKMADDGEAAAVGNVEEPLDLIR